MNRKFVLLCDYGLDDAVATVFLLDNRDETDAVDIVPIGGNSEVGVAYRNAQTLLASYEGNLKGVRIVDTRNVSQPWAKLPSIHGEDGLGDILAPKESSVAVLSYDEWIKEDSGAFTLVSLGPCTLTEDILKKKGADELLIMAGCVNENPNFNGYEFNHALDIPAFERCVKYPHKIATLDTCRTPSFNYANRRYDGKTLFEKLTNRVIELAKARHPNNCYIYDYITVNYLFKPELFTFQKSVDSDGNILNELKVIE
jgi:inosine-uridine nucleoside N-ribohydrolase